MAAELERQAHCEEHSAILVENLHSIMLMNLTEGCLLTRAIDQGSGAAGFLDILVSIVIVGYSSAVLENFMKRRYLAEELCWCRRKSHE